MRTRHFGFAAIPPAPGAKSRPAVVLSDAVATLPFHCQLSTTFLGIISKAAEFITNKHSFSWRCRLSAAVIWTRRNKRWNVRG
ncbi:uncharacterized protein PgNI_01848 [Pyricularia grisea]|uniref:Uncharacterized protein n=1 Tax=Pyricularia grisea TaxID=148305 RepID=A0A6P8BMZ7_PYRGI|nr:uncharacterized protein PgNI_01848 [Pyricularia grisea]TLD17817.1 hypothetical protein PgNI_01848 [Pyricularia grisea]